MGLDASAGPYVTFGASNQAGESNPGRSLSLFDQGVGILDPRAPFHYEPGIEKAYGWFGSGRLSLVDQVPSTASQVALAALQVPVAGTPLTLVTTSGAGITVGQSISRSDTNAAVTGLLVIDGANPPVQNGQNNGCLFYDPTKAIARCVQIKSVGNDSSATFRVRGYDIYNFPMTEVITGATGGNVATGKKAFKYIFQITPLGTLSGSNVSAGQSDTIGMAMRVDRFQYLDLWWPDTTAVFNPTGFTAAVTTTATSTTGDVRGTYALQSASNNAARLFAALQVPPGNIGSAAGLVGVPQFADF
jgi:hypothetical protein